MSYQAIKAKRNVTKTIKTSAKSASKSVKAGAKGTIKATPKGANWFKEQGQWQDRNYTPNTDDIIFFDWNSDGNM